MSRKAALIIFFLLDIMGIAAFFWGFDEARQVFADVSNQTDHVFFQKRIGFSALGITIPLAHAIMFCAYFWPKYTERKYNIAIERSMVVLIILFFIFSIVFSTHIRNHVAKAGYQYCESASSPSILLKTLAYTKDDKVCRQLAEELRRK